MERSRKGEQVFVSLETRFKRAANLTSRKKPQDIRRIKGLNYLPAYRIDTPDLEPMETFVRFLEKVNEFKLSDKNVKANNSLSQGLALARKLEEQLPGNDGAVKLYFEAMEYLKGVNPELAGDIDRIMQKVYDEGRFRER